MKILFYLTLLLSASCNSQNEKNHILTHEEIKICDSLKIDTKIIAKLRNYNSSKIESFHYSMSSTYEDGNEIEINPLLLNGIIFNEENEKSFNLVISLKDFYKELGYSIFVLDNNFGIENQKDKIAILKTTDKIEILKLLQTNGINYDLENKDICKKIEELDKLYNLELIGASGDWCEFIMHKEPQNWLKFSKEMYKF